MAVASARTVRAGNIVISMHRAHGTVYDELEGMQKAVKTAPPSPTETPTAPIIFKPKTEGEMPPEMVELSDRLTLIEKVMGSFKALTGFGDIDREIVERGELQLALMHSIRDHANHEQAMKLIAELSHSALPSDDTTTALIQETARRIDTEWTTLRRETCGACDQE